jgi:hypothetical protein
MATGDLIPNTPIQHEPLQKHRWVMRFPTKLGIQEWQMVSAARPVYNVSESEIHFINQTQYVASKYTFDPLSIKLIDYEGPSTFQALIEWHRLCAEAVTGRMGYAAGYMVDLEIEMLDPTGVAVQKFIYQDCWITKLDGGNLDYSSGELAEIDVTIRYARAIHLF